MQWPTSGDKMNYIDDFGRIHSKPVTMLDKLPCNNAWVYSAYYLKLGGFLCIKSGAVSNCIHMRKRHPVDYKIAQQMSRDEWLGLAYIANLDFCEFPMTHEYIPRNIELPKNNIFKTIASFILAIGEHRNYLHEHKLYHSYRIMFSTPLQDRAYYYRLINTKPPILYQLIEFCDRKFIKPNNDSGRLIRFLKYDIWPGIDCFERYFGEHPITEAARKYQPKTLP